jgi:hypothetical protein
MPDSRPRQCPEHTESVLAIEHADLNSQMLRQAASLLLTVSSEP